MSKDNRRLMGIIKISRIFCLQMQDNTTFSVYKLISEQTAEVCDAT